MLLQLIQLILILTKAFDMCSKVAFSQIGEIWFWHMGYKMSGKLAGQAPRVAIKSIKGNW